MPINMTMDNEAEYCSALRAIQDRIDESRALLVLPDMTREGGSGPVSEVAWQRPAEFLRRSAEWLWRSGGRKLDPPDITPGPDGSVDLHWDYPAYEMLINIPAAGTAGFYGDDRGRITIKGRFDPDVFNEGLLLWLTKAA